MKLHDISFQSLRRRKTKTFFLVIGLVIATASVVTLVTVSRSVNQSIAKNMDEFGANILVVPQSEELSLNYGGMNVSGVSVGDKELRNEDAALIKTIKNKDNISIVSPKLISVESINGKSVLIIGVNFNDEIRLKKWWRFVGLIPSERNEIVIGAEIKKQLNIQLKKEIKIRDKNFVVSAVLEPTGSQDDNVIFMDLAETQILFNKRNSLSLIEVAALCYNCPIEEIVKQTSSKLPNAKVTAIRQTIESKMDAMHRFEHFSFGISLVILIISGLIVFANVSASVNDRTREIGIFRAIGFKQKHIIKIILLEVFAASALAGLLGYLIGILSSEIIVPIISMSKETAVLNEFNLFPVSMALSISVGFISSIYPAIRASRLDPTIALRSL
ncbi:MAG: ABC transporter permease [Bacteroidetes bacterium]|nr:ABC transporter permease [Bacteroidota bacterium]